MEHSGSPMTDSFFCSSPAVFWGATCMCQICGDCSIFRNIGLPSPPSPLDSQAFFSSSWSVLNVWITLKESEWKVEISFHISHCYLVGDIMQTIFSVMHNHNPKRISVNQCTFYTAQSNVELWTIFTHSQSTNNITKLTGFWSVNE